ncbi:DUF3040 domain-containing protein [Embleya sp. NPDC050154]|uniref:DUF3040 domain-containing protein n=1 Tax=Embleya sp. NPDC050154 TaxID=3363988 RepID=UPI0037934B37
MDTSNGDDRVLAGIEQRLADDDPDLAARLAALNRRLDEAQPHTSPRRQFVAVLCAVLITAVVVLASLAKVELEDNNRPPPAPSSPAVPIPANPGPPGAP